MVVEEDIDQKLDKEANPVEEDSRKWIKDVDP